MRWMESEFTAAFDTWEKDFREHPENYMTTEEVAAMETLPLAEGRTACFMAILDKLSTGTSETK